MTILLFGDASFGIISLLITLSSIFHFHQILGRQWKPKQALGVSQAEGKLKIKPDRVQVPLTGNLMCDPQKVFLCWMG